MKKFSFILFTVYTSLCSAAAGQNESWLVDEISAEICEKLQNYPDTSLIANIRKLNIFINTIDQSRDSWNPLLADLPNADDQKARDSYYYQIIDHRLSFTCPEYQEIENKIDQNLQSEPTKLKQYLSVRELIRSIELNAGKDTLLSFFDESLHNKALENDLEKIKKDVDQYKYSSVLNIVSSADHFLVSLSDYRTGELNLLMTITFSEKGDHYADHFTFELKEDIEVSQSDLEFEDVEDDFNDILSIPPVTLPDSTKFRN